MQNKTGKPWLNRARSSVGLRCTRQVAFWIAFRGFLVVFGLLLATGVWRLRLGSITPSSRVCRATRSYCRQVGNTNWTTVCQTSWIQRSSTPRTPWGFAETSRLRTSIPLSRSSPSEAAPQRVSIFPITKPSPTYWQTAWRNLSKTLGLTTPDWMVIQPTATWC